MKKAIIIISIVLVVSLIGIMIFGSPLMLGVKTRGDRCEDSIKDEFRYANENLIADVYVNPTYEEDDDFYTDDSYPKTLEFIVDTKEEYDRVFEEDAGFEVDFEKKMLVVLSYPEKNYRANRISKAVVKDGTLYLTLFKSCPPILGALVSHPKLQVYFVFEMNKTEVDNISVEYYDNLEAITDFIRGDFLK